MLSPEEIFLAKAALAKLQAAGAIKITEPKAVARPPTKGVRGKSGLSAKKLGNKEYQRQLYRQRNPMPSKRGTSGIDWKTLGHTAGMRLWREKLREKRLSNYSQKRI
jgi:hypothetical protein